jgi:hypothetical protein
MWHRIVWVSLLVFVLLGSRANAGLLQDRIARFPNWQHKPTAHQAVGDLYYPEWFVGPWEMTNTLVDLVAPLAPNVTTPGFESNRVLLHQPIATQVRFIVPPNSRRSSILRLKPASLSSNSTQVVVSDRAFNGLNLARAYLGERAVVAVKVDPDNPNRQITLLRSDRGDRSNGSEHARDVRQLVSVVAERSTEAPTHQEFITSELFQQFFQGSSQLYLNTVETTTDYHYHPGENPAITANQITAIYLSPQDPNYFKTKDHPVALYRYQLELRSLPLVMK